MILHRKIFYMMRHGQTTDNAARLISGGGRDPDLTDLGKQQTQQAAAIFAALSPAPSRIIITTLKRTHETALIVAGHDKFHKDGRLNERYLGELDGRISEEEQKRLHVLPGEESAEEQSLRVLSALNHHLFECEAPLFVVHGGTIRRVLEAARLQDRIEVRNAVIYAFRPSGDGWDIGTA